MSTSHRRLVSLWMSLGLSLGGSTSASTQEEMPDPVRAKEETLQKILEFEKLGKSLYAQERIEPARYDDRVTAYWNASFFVARYIKDYASDPRTLANLCQSFRMAYDLERADRIPLAVQQYQECLKHSKITDPGAVWDERGIRLSRLIEERLAELGYKEPTASVPRDQAEARSGVWAFFNSPSKGGIERSTQTYNLLRGEGFRPLTVQESLEVAARPGLFLNGGGQAIAMLEKPIAKAGLRCQTARTSDLVVFTVSFSSIPPNTASDLAEEIGAIRQAIIQKYFQARRRDPVPLVVYASMGDERLGGFLSQAMHFRARNELEGYYEPLDHSLVLRKNCYDSGRPRPWVLGTAAHELTHALIKPEFPNAPIWLDEGMASLQEEQDENGRPLDNYRLYFLRAALDSHRLPTVERLVNSANRDWFGNKAPLMYAVARYFCFYLESSVRSRNALIDVYRAMKESRTSGGAKTRAREVLEKVTGMTTLALDEDFRRFLNARDLHSIDSKWGFLRIDSEQYIRNLDPAGTAQLDVVRVPSPPVTGRSPARPTAEPVTRPANPASTPAIATDAVESQRMQVQQRPVPVPSPSNVQAAPGTLEIRVQVESETVPPVPPVPTGSSPPVAHSGPRSADRAVQAPIDPPARTAPSIPGATDAPPAPRPRSLSAMGLPLRLRSRTPSRSHQPPDSGLTSRCKCRLRVRSRTPLRSQQLLRNSRLFLSRQLLRSHLQFFLQLRSCPLPRFLSRWRLRCPLSRRPKPWPSPFRMGGTTHISRSYLFPLPRPRRSRCKPHPPRSTSRLHRPSPGSWPRGDLG